MRRWGPALTGGATFVAVTVLATAVTGQLAPGFVAGTEGEPLSPVPRPVVRASTEPLEVREEIVAARRGPVRTPVAAPAGGSEVAVVLVAGAGATDRYALSSLADGLAARGVAAISYDKTRVGYSARRRDYAALARDALDVTTATRSLTGARRVGLLGFSEGGWVAPLAVVADPRVAFLILASAPVVTPLEQATWTVDRGVAGLPTPVRRVPAMALAAGRGALDYLDHDSTGTLAAVDVPTLAVWGAEDPTIPVGTAARRVAAAVTAPLRMVVLPAAGHRPAGPDWPDAITDWIQTGSPGAATVLGVEPASRLGVGRSPTRRWYTHPALPLAVATLLAGWAVRRQTRTPPARRISHVPS